MKRVRLPLAVCASAFVAAACVTFRDSIEDRLPATSVRVLRYPDSLELGPFRWFGATPGSPLPPLGDRLARHSRGNAEGIKAERPAHRIVRGGLFERLDNITELVDRLVGAAHA